MKYHGQFQQAVDVVRNAIDLGCNLIDTAEYYRTESVVGQAIAGRRDQVILATKFGPRTDGHIRTPQQIQAALDQSLRNLGTDVIDIYQVHGVHSDIYPDVVDRILPVLKTMQKQGKIRFIGITEAFETQMRHQMLSMAVKDDCWDTMMVGFNYANPSARHHVFQATQQKNIGVMCMFAIRRALTQASAIAELVKQLVAEGQMDASLLEQENPLAFLLEDCQSYAEAGYRFCAHEPGIDCVLSGTGSIAHLQDNFRSLQMPALPKAARDRLEELFGHIDTVSSN
jgi:aryl-alcohol dehydrogenase-like predicted oxidoreductase